MTLLADATDRLRAQAVVDLVPRLTLVAVVLVSHYDGRVLVATAVVAVVAFREARLYRSPWLWLAYAAALGAYQYVHWQYIDDHVMLATYWVLAIGLAFTTSDPVRTLRVNARALVVLTFLLAAAWKIATPEFRDGTFFEYAFLQDSRFEFVAENVGGLTPEMQAANEAVVSGLPADFSGGPLQSTDRVGALAMVFTAWGLVIEAAVALVWLIPIGTRQWIRFGVLLAFVGTTYLVAPVGGFGAILLTMAVARTEEGSQWRAPLIGGIVAISLWAPVWQLVLGR